MSLAVRKGPHIGERKKKVSCSVLEAWVAAWVAAELCSWQERVCAHVFSLKFVIAEGSGRLIDCCAPAAGSKTAELICVRHACACEGHAHVV